MPESLCNCYAAETKNHTEDDHAEDCVAMNFGAGVECGVCLGCISARAVRETSDPVPPAPAPVPGLWPRKASVPVLASPVLTGTVKFFLSERSYGFIVGDDGSEPFVWYRDIVRRDNEFRVLVKGLRVSYKLSAGEKGPKAVEVRVLEEQTPGVRALFEHMENSAAVERAEKVLTLQRRSDEQ